MKNLAQKTNGKGGGRPDLAQGGTDNPEKLEHAISSLQTWLYENM